MCMNYDFIVTHKRGFESYFSQILKGLAQIFQQISLLTVTLVYSDTPVTVTVLTVPKWSSMQQK